MILALFALVFQVHATSADQSCAGGSLDGRAGIFLTLTPRLPSDTLIRASVCYAGSPTLPALGSYHGRLFYDATRMTAVRAEESSAGVQAENLAKPGVVDFAGASASGFGSGQLLAVLLRAPHGYQPSLRLEMIEANGVTNGSILSQLKIFGVLGTSVADSTKETIPSSGSCPAQSSATMPQRPTLTRLVPAVVPMDSLARGASVTIDAEGCGFDRKRNIVRMGGAVIAEVPSNADGTSIRFSFPTQMPMGGGGAALKPGPGSYTISVSAGALTSNALTLEVR
jgi:hypothetical protein